MAAPLTYQRRLLRKLPRVAKFGRQWLRALATGRPGARFVFVVGAQRSGTRLPLQLIDQAPETATFSEGVTPFFDDVFLEPLDRIEELGLQNPASIIALKPICETHRVHELLDRFPSSKAIWIFRNYVDTARSASVKWTSGKEVLKRLARRELPPGDWRAGGVSNERLRDIESLYRDDMSLYEANAVLWYVRNALFFDLGANERSEILLVRYEDLVANRPESIARIFTFIGSPVPAEATSAIRDSSRPRRPDPDLAAPIKERCEALHARLLAHYESTLRSADRQGQ
jgi:hypothetical protein